MEQPSIREILDSPAYERQKAILSMEINKARLEINYKEFEKTKEEKALLHTLKLQWELTNPEKPKLIGRYEF